MSVIVVAVPILYLDSGQSSLAIGHAQRALGTDHGARVERRPFCRTGLGTVKALLEEESVSRDEETTNEVDVVVSRSYGVCRAPQGEGSFSCIETTSNQIKTDYGTC